MQAWNSKWFDLSSLSAGIFHPGILGLITAIIPPYLKLWYMCFITLDIIPTKCSSALDTDQAKDLFIAVIFDIE